MHHQLNLVPTRSGYDSTPRVQPLVRNYILKKRRKVLGDRDKDMEGRSQDQLDGQDLGSGDVLGQRTVFIHLISLPGF